MTQNKKVVFASAFKDKNAQYIYNAVDNHGDKVVDKIKKGSSEDQISPYLRRPLRSFADVIAQRQARAGLAVEAEQARKLIGQGSSQDAQERLSA